MSKSAQAFATKLAFVPDATAVASPTKASSKIPSAPSIGDKKPTRPTPPATIGARQASRIASPPSNPAMSAAQSAARFASQSMRPTTKTAGELTEIYDNKSMRKINKAPRYSSRARKGKKVMPLPHATQTKKAYALMNNSCEFIGEIDSNRVHDGMMTAKAIEGYLAPTTDLEKIAKWNYIKRMERTKSAQAFGKQMAEDVLEKQALGGIGTTVGALGGVLGAPKGNKMEGLGRGTGQGLGWDVGGGLGMFGGGIGGGVGGGVLAALIAKLSGMDPQGISQMAGTGASAGMIGGMGLGYLGGGELGRRTAKGMMGDPTYQQPQRGQDQTAGDEEADVAQMAAP